MDISNESFFMSHLIVKTVPESLVKTKTKKNRIKLLDFSCYNDSSFVHFRMDSCTRRTILNNPHSKFNFFRKLFAHIFSRNLTVNRLVAIESVETKSALRQHSINKPI